MSVSRLAAPPQEGQDVLTKESWEASGLPLWSSLKVTSSGNSTGKSEEGTGTIPQASQ